MKNVNFKKLFLAVALCVATGLVSAQGFYVKAGAGYSFGAGKSSFYLERDGDTYSDKPISLGKGINTCLGAGYMFNKYIGAELAFNYAIGLENTFTSKYTYSGYDGGIAPVDVNVNSETKIKNSGLGLMPALKFVAPMGDKLSLYSRFGLVIPVTEKTIITYDETQTSTLRTETSFRKTEVTSFFKLGAAAAMGVSCALTDKLDLFAEVNGVWSSFQFKKSTVVKATENGQDILPNMTTYQKETEYNKEHNYVTDNNEPNKPSQQLSDTFPASNIGLTIGVAFKF